VTPLRAASSSIVSNSSTAVMGERYTRSLTYVTVLL